MALPIASFSILPSLGVLLAKVGRVKEKAAKRPVNSAATGSQQR